MRPRPKRLALNSDLSVSGPELATPIVFDNLPLRHTQSWYAGGECDKCGETGDPNAFGLNAKCGIL